MLSRPTATILTLAVLAVSAVGCAKVADNTLIDPRDGQKYRTVKIGGQRWMAKNLNFVTDSSVCYDNDKSNCKKYGRLYDWNDALSACPAGWRVPSDADWDSLVVAAGGLLEGDCEWKFAGKKLKSRSGWANRDEFGSSGNGTDEFGFSALPGGFLETGGGFYSARGYGKWWSATEIGAHYASYRTMSRSNDDVGSYGYSKTDRSSLRCVEGHAARHSERERDCTPANGFADNATSSYIAALIASDTEFAAAIARGIADIANAPAIDTAWPIGGQFNPAIRYESFTDGRDGKTYRTVKIGAQLWMAENLNFETGGSWCYGNDERNCQRYGRLYTWDAAMAACPANWRLPGDAEWAALMNAAGDSAMASKKLKSALGWMNLKSGASGNGTDDYGFSALPGGYRYSGGNVGNQYFNAVGREGLWWCAAALDDSTAQYRAMSYFTNTVDWAHEARDGGLAVRCVAVSKSKSKSK